MKSKSFVKSAQRYVLRSQYGNPTSSELRADTLASYFESIHWTVRPTLYLLHTNHLHRVDVDCNTISYRELMIAIDQMKYNKKPGADEVPAEFWKYISLPGSNTCNWMLSLFQLVWDQKRVPTSWHIAQIAAMFEKVMQANVATTGPFHF